MNTIRTPEKRAAFLSALADCANVSDACRAAEIGRASAYQWRDEDPEFAADWAKRIAHGAEMLEDEATRRAREGWEEPVWYKGDQVGSVRQYSDTLLIFLLKGQMRDNYGDKVQQEITGEFTLAELIQKARLRASGDV